MLRTLIIMLHHSFYIIYFSISLKSFTTQQFVFVIITVIGLSIFTMAKTNVFAQQNGFQGIKVLKPTIPPSRIG